MPPSEFTRLAKVLLDNGTDEGKALLTKAITRAFGVQWDIMGVPNDMSKAAVAAMMMAKAEWPCEVQTTRRGHTGGVKNCRVVTLPTTPDPPAQIQHRGLLILLKRAERAKPSANRSWTP